MDQAIRDGRLGEAVKSVLADISVPGGLSLDRALDSAIRFSRLRKADRPMLARLVDISRRGLRNYEAQAMPRAEKAFMKEVDMRRKAQEVK